MSIKTFELISTPANGINLISYIAFPEIATIVNLVAGLWV